MGEEKENPYTREDVLKAIKGNGGKAEGLDLSGKVFEENIDLHGLDLRGIILENAVFKSALPQPPSGEHARLDEDELLRRLISKIGAHFEEANLSGAQLRRARLENAHLEKASLIDANLEETVLSDAHLERANLMYANFERAQLSSANLQEADLSFADFGGAILGAAHLDGAALVETNLEGTFLYLANLTRAYLSHPILSFNTKIQHVNWGNYILGEEINGQFRWAEDTYRQLKTWYTEHGMYDVAGKFYYREMEAKRKEQSWKSEPLSKLWSWVINLLCGYGEKPERAVISAVVFVFGLALAYYSWGSFTSSSFWDTLYYSVVSFTAVGYGSWAPQPTGWAKGVGATEAVIGVFMMALFLVTFVRKMTR